MLVQVQAWRLFSIHCGFPLRTSERRDAHGRAIVSTLVITKAIKELSHNDAATSSPRSFLSLNVARGRQAVKSTDPGEVSSSMTFHQKVKRSI